MASYDPLNVHGWAVSNPNGETIHHGHPTQSLRRSDAITAAVVTQSYRGETREQCWARLYRANWRCVRVVTHSLAREALAVSVAARLGKHLIALDVDHGLTPDLLQLLHDARLVVQTQ